MGAKVAFELDGRFGRKPRDTHYCSIVSQIDTYLYYLSLNLFAIVNSRFKYATQEGSGEGLNRMLRYV